MSDTKSTLCPPLASHRYSGMIVSRSLQRFQSGSNIIPLVLQTPVQSHCCSHSFLAHLNGFLIRLEVDVASVPHGDGLHKDALFLSAFDIPDDVEPRSHVYVELLYPLQYMFDIDIRDYGRTNYRVVVLEPQCRGFGDVLIDTAIQSVSTAPMASAPSTSPESGPWFPALFRANHSIAPDSMERDQTWC
jgi:hypothetical protein